MRWIAGLLLGLFACAGGVARAQFFYGLSCKEVVKLDALTGRQIAVLPLASRTPLVPQESPRTAFCDLDTMTYDAAHHTAAVEVNDRPHRVYRSLLFSVPDFQLLAARRSHRPWHEDGDENPVSDTQPPPRLPGMVTAGPHSGWLDLRTYRTDSQSANSQITSCTAYGQGKMLLSAPIAAAGPAVVLKATCTEGTRLFVAHPALRQITPLALPAEAALAALFTTGDGRYLLAAGRGPGVKIGGGTAWLIDLATGAFIGQWSDPRLTEAAFLGFANHTLLFSAQPANFVLNTSLALLPTAEAGGFFADR